MASEQPRKQSNQAGFGGTNRRGKQRFLLSLPMKYRDAAMGWKDAWKPGIVHDMSATGIRIEGSAPLRQGIHLEIKMDWPGIYHGTNKAELLLLGTVCRSQAESSALQIAHSRFRVEQAESTAPRRHPPMRRPRVKSREEKAAFAA
ncbi:MAG: PilZ domain-containing protein [Candidatus Solibacter sp.]